jgi:hypothetical protein
MNLNRVVSLICLVCISVVCNSAQNRENLDRWLKIEVFSSTRDDVGKKDFIMIMLLDIKFPRGLFK